MAGTGLLTVYAPGLQPNHVRSDSFLCDDQWHYVAMHYEPQRVRLYVDGKLVTEQAVNSKQSNSVAGGFAVGRLVEGGLGCDGLIDFVHVHEGVRDIAPVAAPPKADKATVGLWLFGTNDGKEVP